MKVRPRAAFVVTFSAMSLLAGCKKSADGGLTNGKCEPPDCHMNPPPQNPPVPSSVPTDQINANPPPPTANTNVTPPPTINANPPPIVDAGAPATIPTVHRNPPPPQRKDGGPL